MSSSTNSDNTNQTNTTDNPIEAPRNPKFGSGIFRRRIRLVNSPGKVLAELEDGSHGFRSTIFHDGNNVTSVVGEALRYPMDSCPGAISVLQQFESLPLGSVDAQIRRAINARSHCTHLYDLTLWGVQHALRTESQRVYDIEIEDELDTPKLLKVFKNGRCVLEWKMRNWQILSPEALQGKTIHKGFSAWIQEYYGDDEQAKEYAWLAQKGYLVAQARRFDINAIGGTSGTYDKNMLGVCHTYSEGRVENATHTVNSYRDFSDSPEQLLRFE